MDAPISLVSFPRMLLCLLVSWGGLLFAEAAGQSSGLQGLDPTLQPTQYAHDAWQTADGLPQNTVNALTQSSAGYLWIGTGEGLARFDGLDFKIYDTAETAGLASNEIWALLEDRAGGLWIGTSGGGVSHRAGETWRTYTAEDGLSGNLVKTLFEDRRGRIWIGTIGQGVNRFDGTSFEQFAPEEGLAGNTALSIEQDRTGTIWIGTEAGVSRFRNGRLTSWNRLDGRAGKVVRALREDESGALWIGTNEGLVRLLEDRLEVFTTEDGLCGNIVSALYEDRAGALWVGTLDGGVCRYYDGEFSAFTRADGLTHSQVRAFYEDGAGSLWIGTDGGGLNRLRDTKFTPIGADEGLSPEPVATVLEDRDGTVWVGTDGGGLNKLAQDHVTRVTAADGLPSNYVYALHEDRAGDLWIGMMEGGLCRRMGTDYSCFAKDDGLPSNTVWAIEEDESGALWVGTDKGLGNLHDGKITAYTTGDGLSNSLIMALREDRSGDLWVGTYGGGLSRWRDSTFSSFTTEDGLSTNVILTLHEDAEGMLWVGTKGGGLCRRRGTRFQCFTTKDGLHNDTVVQILSDDQGYLWLASQQGISRVSKRMLNAFATGRRDTIRPTIYDETDGLRSREMNGGAQPGAWKTADGRLLFASLRGLATIHPENISARSLPPPVHVEALEIDGRAKPVTDGVELSPDVKDVAFHFTGIDLAVPAQVQFKYKLEGYDQEWKDAGTRRAAYYTNLPPGHYRFQVKARNHAGIWSEQAAVVDLRLAPHFYETPWFYVLAVAGFFGLIAGGYYLRVRRIRARERTLEKRVAAQTKELTRLNRHLEAEVQRQLEQKLEERRRYEQQLIAAKEEAEEMNRLKDAFLANMSHELRTPLTAIIGYAEVLRDLAVQFNLPDEAREFATTIEKAGQRLLKTLTSVLDLAQLESGVREVQSESFDIVEQTEERMNLFKKQARDKGLVLALHAPGRDNEHVSMDRTAYVRILTNLLSNAIKFTDEGRIDVSVRWEGQEVVLTVADTGIGIGEDFLPDLFDQFKQESAGIDRSHEGTGLGLPITKELVALMDGDIAVESEKGVGTTFTVRLPTTVEYQTREVPLYN